MNTGDFMTDSIKKDFAGIDARQLGNRYRRKHFFFIIDSTIGIERFVIRVF